MRMCYRWMFLFFVFSALPFHPALADELYLTNGDRISGQLVHFSPAFCLFTPSYAETLHIDAAHVSRVTTTQTVAVELNSGDRITGRLMSDEKKSILLSSRSLGTVSFKLEDVAQISGLDSSNAESERLVAQGRGTDRQPDQRAPEPAPPADETIGEAPETDIRQIFLRESTVLLKPGEVELDSTIEYTRDDTDFLIPAGTQFIPVNLIDRGIRLFEALRVGVLNDLELFVNVPVAWEERELQFPPNSTNKDSDFGIGDISAGAKYLLLREGRNRPDTVWSLSVLAPTGEDPNPLDSSAASVGDGSWQLSNRLTFIKSFDPAVLFAGMGYTHAFDRTLHGVEVEFSDIFDYSFGLGVAINDQISVSGQVLGAYETEVKFDDQTVVESGREPISFRSSLTYRIARDHYVEPYVTFGLNDDATDIFLGISYAFKLL